MVSIIGPSVLAGVGSAACITGPRPGAGARGVCGCRSPPPGCCRGGEARRAPRPPAGGRARVVVGPGGRLPLSFVSLTALRQRRGPPPRRDRPAEEAADAVLHQVARVP